MNSRHEPDGNVSPVIFSACIEKANEKRPTSDTVLSSENKEGFEEKINTMELVLNHRIKINRSKSKIVI